MADVFSHPWLGTLFGDDEISALWSAEAQIEHYRAFEAALAEALGNCGIVSPAQWREAAKTAKTSKIDLSALANATAKDGVPIPEFVRQLRNAADQNQDAIHTGATSQDVLDTALALTLRGVTDTITPRLSDLDEALSRLGDEHGKKSLMGRTRMQAALPIKVADRVKNWRQPLFAHIDALTKLRQFVERLQLGGPVGTRDAFGSNAEKVAADMAKTLKLNNGPVWHTDRTGIVEYSNRLSLITGSLGKIGQDASLMALQGIDEIVLEAGGGSSAMPHKSNPILAELLVTLARFNATQAAGLHHSLVHEQERSGAAWMLEWMTLPSMSLATGRALTAATSLINSISDIGSHI